MSLANVTEKSRLRFARNLVNALERGDADAELEAVNAILETHETRLHGELTRIAGDLRNALSASQYSGQISRLATTDLPDAQQRLNHVIELTESAADTSLTAVERALPLVKRVRAAVDALSRGDGAGETLGQVAIDSNDIEQCLSDILMAQGFQDLTGQIIRRVVKLVAELEDCLSTWAGPVNDEPGDRDDSLRSGQGPAIEGLDDDALQHQDDVDDLLGQLGL